LPDVAWVRLRGLGSGRRAIFERYAPLENTRVVAMPGVQAERVHVAVVDERGENLGSATFRVADIDGQEVLLRLGARFGALRLVDPLGAPLAGVTVAVGGSDLAWLDARITDAAGVAHFEGALGQTVDVWVQHTTAGGGLVLGVPLGEAPADVVVDLRASLALRLVDGTTPVAGAAIWLEDGHGRGASMPTVVTDESGLARLEGCIESPVVGRVRAAGVWPTDLALQATRGASITTQQVRRRGSLCLQATAGGAPAAGAVWRIRSEEFGRDVLDWVRTGDVLASDPGGRADQHGELRLTGLPRGPYTWSCRSEDGREGSGRFDIPAGAPQTVKIELP
jgi:hypothetical protein